MGLGFYLYAAVIFGPPIYQFIYFRNHATISRGKAFICGLGYWAVLFCTLFAPIMIASEFGTVATVIAAIFAIAATGGAFYLIFKKRSKTLAEACAEDKFLVIKEMIACFGMLFGSIIIFVVLVLGFFAGFTNRRK